MTIALKALAVALLSAAPAVAQEAPLKMAFSAEPYPPFTFKASSGEWAGFEIDMGRAVCAAMERDCELAPTGWSGIIPALTSGKVDFILGSMSITDERDQVIDFSRAYYSNDGLYVGREDIAFSGEQDLADKIIAVQAAKTYNTYALEKLAPLGAQIRIYDQHEQMVRDLEAGRVDVVFGDKIAMISFLQRDGSDGYAELGQAPEDPILGEGVGVGLREGEPELLAAMNEAVAAVLADGTCAALSQQYFGADICAP